MPSAYDVIGLIFGIFGFIQLVKHIVAYLLTRLPPGRMRDIEDGHAQTTALLSRLERGDEAFRASDKAADLRAELEGLGHRADLLALEVAHWHHTATLPMRFAPSRYGRLSHDCNRLSHDIGHLRARLLLLVQNKTEHTVHPCSSTLPVVASPPRLLVGSRLQPFLDVQAEKLVGAIRDVLSGVRSRTPPPTLNENLSQIVMIVSGIIAVCEENFPVGIQEQGEAILRELGQHVDELSKIQARSANLTKEVRREIAISSFAVAKALKFLMQL
ncbi:hypothetical protein C8Q77DRAFT_1161751 [Trametes polyzona]|nr:hypothetical protein C8Q77DRAFT_1161751 [Trametes polyzona]